MALQSPAAKVYGQDILNSFDENGLTWGGYPRSIIFDAATVLWLLHPDCITTKDSYVEVLAGQGTPMDGCTYTDFRCETWNGNKANVKIAMSMDTKVFVDTVVDLFKNFN